MRRSLPLIVAAMTLAASLIVDAQQQTQPKKPRPATTQQSPGAQPNWWGPGPDPTRDRAEGPSATGIVEAVNQSSITLRTACGFNTYAVAAETEVVVLGNTATLADVKTGMRGVVLFQFMPGLVTQAKRVQAQPRLPSGGITSIQSNVVTIKSIDQGEWFVTVTPETQIMIRQAPFTANDLRVGYRAHAEGMIDGQNVTARVLRLEPPSFKGAITQISNNTIQLKALDFRIADGVLNDRTVVMIKPRVGPNYRGTRADIKQGMAANITGHTAEGQPMDVLLVELLIGQ